MSQVVVDASVAAKWLFPEDRSEYALLLRQSYEELWAPDLLLPEIANVLWKKVLRGEVPESQRQALIEAILALPVRFHPSGPLLHTAVELAFQLEQSVYDCLYLALALALDCPLVTADRRFYDRVARHESLSAHIRWIAGADAVHSPRPVYGRPRRGIRGSR